MNDKVIMVQVSSILTITTKIIIMNYKQYIINMILQFDTNYTKEYLYTLQVLDLSRVKFVCQGEAVYLASSTTCWRLEPVALDRQIQEVLRLEKFEDALRLAELMDEPRADKQKRILEIKQAYGYSEFAKKHFETALQTFAELEMDPPLVIGLYTDLLPENMRGHFTYPVDLPQLREAERETATKALIEYLTQKRMDLHKLGDVGEDTEVAHRHALGEIIDTTLLKCYLRTNPALVGPLLRVANRCNVAESEQMLRAAERYQELVMLYHNRGLHRKALELLKRHANKPGRMNGLDRTVEYLQRLGGEHLDIVLEFSLWVLEADAAEGFTIFASDDYPEVRTLPQARVLTHLKTHTPALVVRYLEHAINVWGSADSDFHNQLVNTYLQAVVQPMKDYLQTLQGEPPCAPGDEPGELGRNRTRLLKFLDSSKYYEPETLLSRFFTFEDALFEERAILLGRIGRHDQALAIYVRRLKNPRAAVEYCNRAYECDNEYAKDVYVDLLQIFLLPPEGEPANIGAALNILRNYPDKVDTTRVLAMLPHATRVSDVHGFLKTVLQECAQKRRNTQILRNLTKAERLQANEALLHYTNRRVVIDDERLCQICHKPVRTSAFVCQPNGVIVHLFCYNKQQASGSGSNTVGEAGGDNGASQMMDMQGRY